MVHQEPPSWFPFVLFLVIHLVASTMLGVFSGWYFLMRRFPDRPEEKPLLRLSRQSGWMGLMASMRWILIFSTCSSGLRVSMNRFFGPFSRPFFVPWEQIRVTRKKTFWWSRVVLTFGESLGYLSIDADVADKLWRSIPERWPEAGPQG
jgi:hypothetical protein